MKKLQLLLKNNQNRLVPCLVECTPVKTENGMTEYTFFHPYAKKESNRNYSKFLFQLTWIKRQQKS